MHSIPAQRLDHQFLARPLAGTAAALVAWMGAVQAQEYEHARWGLGLRLAGDPTAAAIEREIAGGAILRTHVMRPTWHFVAADDLFWMQALTGPRVHLRMAPYNRRLELDASTLTRATRLIERALGDEARAPLTRAELGQVLHRARIAITPMRMAHIAMHAELEGVICSGPRRERQFTYALAASRVRRHRRFDRDESLGELATRYFQSHGPATIRDFVWWSGLTTPDSVRATEIARASSRAVDGRTYFTIDGPASTSSGSSAPSFSRRRRRTVHMLPIYDEYLVAYRDRFAVPHGRTTIVANGRVVGFMHALVIDGQVAGTWRTAPARPGQADLTPLRRLTATERGALAIVIRRYARFVS
jgi:hypothetical protein